MNIEILAQALKKNIQKFVREKQTLINFVNTSILLMLTIINIFAFALPTKISKIV